MVIELILFFKVNSRLFICDLKEDSQLTLVTDRSQGGSSIQDGSLELMLHRITLNDDSLGVGEPLNEKGIDGKGLIINGKVRLLFTSVSESVQNHRKLAHEINTAPVAVFFGSAPRVKANNLLTDNGVDLPNNLHLLTLMHDVDAGDNVLLVRIEHFYELGEDKEMSVEVSIDIRKVFESVVNVIGVEEMALGGNMGVEKLGERLKWMKEGKKLTKVNEKVNEFVFEFKPMQIRTFRLWYVKND